jgi:type II secretory pathway component GspD/PulD (secretin)
VKRLAALTLFCGTVSLSTGAAQDPPKVQRTHYAVRNADPAVLAEVVGAHFKGDATLIAAPAGSGSAVLVSGSPAAVPEVVKLLEQLDRKPRAVEVEVTVAELPAPKDGKEFTAADVAAVDALVKDGKGQRIRLAAVEGQQATIQVGGDKPYVTGSVVRGAEFGGKGVTQKSVSYRPTGTTVKLTPRVGAENVVALDLSVQESKVRAAEEEVGAPAFENSSLATKLSIPAGKSVIAQAVRAEGKAGPTVTVVVVTARVVDEQPRAGGR